MEAAACRTHSVALAVGGLPESIDDGRTGLLADDNHELAEQTRRVIRDPELRERLGAAALEKVRGLTWDRTAQRTLDALEEQRLTAGEGSAVRKLARELAGWDTGRAAGLGAAGMGSNGIALVVAVGGGRRLHASGDGWLAVLI